MTFFDLFLVSSMHFFWSSVTLFVSSLRRQTWASLFPINYFVGSESKAGDLSLLAEVGAGDGGESQWFTYVGCGMELNSLIASVFKQTCPTFGKSFLDFCSIFKTGFEGLDRCSQERFVAVSGDWAEKPHDIWELGANVVFISSRPLSDGTYCGELRGECSFKGSNEQSLANQKEPSPPLSDKTKSVDCCKSCTNLETYC